MRQQDAPPAVDGTPASIQTHQYWNASGHVALLAATALGFAYAPTADSEAHTRRLVALAPDTESLTQAQTAVLTLEVGSAQARTQAAALLRRAGATQNVAGPRGAGPSGNRVAVRARTAATGVRA